MWNITHLKSQFTQKRSNLMFPSVLFLRHVWKNVHDSAYCSILWKSFSQDSCYVSHRNETEYTHAGTHISCQVNFLIYHRITSTKFPSFCMTNLSAGLTNLTTLLTQSNECSSYISWPILASSPFWLQENAAVRAHDFAHSPELWHQLRFTKVTCAWSQRLAGIKPAMRLETLVQIFPMTVHVSIFRSVILWGLLKTWSLRSPT
jgi:hypothetical protein